MNYKYRLYQPINKTSYSTITSKVCSLETKQLKKTTGKQTVISWHGLSLFINSFLPVCQLFVGSYNWIYSMSDYLWFRGQNFRITIIDCEEHFNGKKSLNWNLWQELSQCFCKPSCYQLGCWCTGALAKCGLRPLHPGSCGTTITSNWGPFGWLEIWGAPLY